MIGNDIIDLQLASTQSNWQRKGWLEKQFTQSERDIVAQSKTPELTVWRLWSMKEAAYKGVVRRYKRRFFNPKLLQCSPQSPTLGTVQYEGVFYQVSTVVSTDFIYSTANTPEYTYCGFPAEPKDVIGSIARKLNLDKNKVEIRKDNSGCPNAFYQNQQLTSEMTITDHGNYWAVGFNLQAL